MREIPFADPGTPPTSSSWRFLGWTARLQWPTLALGLACGGGWMVSLALLPAAVGRGVDEGIVAGDLGGLLRWSGVIAGLGLLTALLGGARHFFAVHNWLYAAYRSAQVTARGVDQAGPALTRTLPSGEVVAVFANDVMRVGGLYDTAGRFAGAILSYVVVAVILLSTSTPLGLLVLLGCPLLLASLSFVVRPLQRRQAVQREEAGRLTTLGADTVAGLRVLRGIGGEQTFLRRYELQSSRVRAAGFRVAGMQAGLDSAQVLLPGVFVVLVTWLGARYSLDGTISPGQLVAFYGYAAFLTMPLATATEFLDRTIRANIGAGKILRVLAIQPDQAGGSRPGARSPDPGADLVEPRSGARVGAGLLTAIVSARPEQSAAVADRLGRFGPEPVETTWGGTRLADLDLAEVRRRIVVSEADPRLFTGVLREELVAARGPGLSTADDEALLAALEVASGGDILEALPNGLDSEVEERGRSYSGGQRQRLALARSLLTDAEVLVLVEPTSAVDTHTEARIAGRLALARAGRTTVVTTVSPLLLDRADVVLFLDDGRVKATGTHRDLSHGCAAYAHVVMRGEDD